MYHNEVGIRAADRIAPFSIVRENTVYSNNTGMARIRLGEDDRITVLEEVWGSP